MFSKKVNSINIAGLKQPPVDAIQAEGKETILQVALRNNIKFPNNCRVGACAVCKCKLKSGKVKELTETAYVLSADEIQQGFILACQSIPKSDIEIEVQSRADVDIQIETFSGIISKQQSLTHDIVAITIQIEGQLDFIAGQYANISIPGVIDVPRAYSFATTTNTSGASLLTFYIRKLDGGEMSHYFHQQDIIGKSVHIEGPLGDFYLREDDSPILCIAGGSGLAPVKALLEDALQKQVNRPVIFLFGARTQQDIYCSDEMNSLKKIWPASFHYEVILSEEPIDSNWNGKRGFICSFLEENITDVKQIYMCGPPVMLDAVEVELKKLSKTNKLEIYADKFITTKELIAN